MEFSKVLAAFLLLSLLSCALVVEAFKNKTVHVKVMKENKKATLASYIKSSTSNKHTSLILHDSGSPSEIFTTVKDKLSTFTSPLATKAQAKLDELNTKWKTLPETDRKGIMTTMTTIATNIEKFGDAGNNPIDAIQGAINIVGAVSSLFGPTGQLVSIGLGFVSALLGLFGKGPKPKPLSQVVREQIDEAFKEYRFETLSDKASGLVSAFKGSTSYLEGVLNSEDSIDTDHIKVAACRVPMTQGDIFIGELGTVISRMFKENNPAESRKCLKYCELYAQLAALKDMIITQIITMSSGVMKSDAAGLLSYQTKSRNEAKSVLEPLYNSDYGQKILPYFDPDLSVATDAYATAVLNLGQYDRSKAGMYCLVTQVGDELKDAIWSTYSSDFYVNGKPYITVASTNNENCYWKLVPHGDNLYSIVNKKGCESNADWCGSLFSFDLLDGNAYANIEATDGLMWEINFGSDWNMIRTKWGCSNSKNSWCDKELQIIQRVITRTRRFRMPKGQVKSYVGALRPSDGLYHWQLKKRE